MTPAELKNAMSRITDLAAEADGWLDGDGKAPASAALDAARGFVAALPADSPRPYIYPTPEGGVRVEWNDSPVEQTFAPDGTMTIYMGDEE